MQRTHVISSFVLAPALVLAFGLSQGCASMSTQESVGLTQVDDLLSGVERVQVETVLVREKSNAAYEALRALVAADYNGDPKAGYADLMQKIELSRNQSQTLASTVAPMKSSAETVFSQWTASLESFGSPRLRQASQTRLEETRTRYQAIVNAATSVQLASNTFNTDLSDHALFLARDFNQDAVSMIATEVQALSEQQRELSARCDACVAASKSYIESAALRGQLAVDATELKPQATPQKNGATTTTTPAPRKRVRTLPAPGATTPSPTPTPGTPSNGPTSASNGTTPTTGSTPAPAPESTSGSSHSEDTTPPGGGGH